MELTTYIRVLRRWLWLILLVAFIFGAINFVLLNSRPPVYRTSTTVIIGNQIRNPDPDWNEIQTSEDLSQTYAELLRTYSLLETVVNELTLDISPDALLGRVTTRTVLGTSLLEIQVTYDDPIIAADIANQLAAALIETSPTGLSAEEEAQVNIANSQVEALNTELAQLNQELGIIDSALDEETDETVRAQLSQQRTTLANQINETRSNIANFISINTTIQQNVNSISVVDPARVPTQTSGASITVRVIMTALFGAAITFGAAIIYEYLNDTIQTANDATTALKLPVLGVIGRIGNKRKDKRSSRLITELAPLSSTVEQYQNLRTNLMFLLDSNKSETEAKVIIVTSPSASEGKSTTAANLAISLAKSGQRVLLIDADLRRPRQHELFGLPNEKGLSTLLSGHPIGEEQGEKLDFASYDGIRDFLHETQVRGLRVITSGFIPINPGEILGGALIKRWLKSFKESPNVDVVIFDTPPSLAISDSRVLAGTVGAKIVVVLEANRTRRRSAIHVLERFQYIQDNLLGIVVNNVAPGFEDYYGYDYSYYIEDFKPQVANRAK